MPHFPKPFYKKGRRCWYVEIDRKQHKLGPDKDQAFERYHELMRSRPKIADIGLAIGVIDAFLDWVRQNKSERTFEWYQRHCQIFARSIPPSMLVGQLKKNHLTRCIAGLADWSSTTRNGLCRAVCRAFQWAEDEELILRSPLGRFKKPRSKRREVNVTPDEFESLLSLTQNEHFGDLLITAWETGARPQEIIRVEKRHIDLALGRWVFPVEESKGQRLPRVVYLNPRALEITQRLCLRHPQGPLFRNEDGKPWNRHSLACAFGRIQIIIGMKKMQELGINVESVKRFKKSAFADKEALCCAREQHQDDLRKRRKAVQKLARKHGRKYCLYAFRHAWATRALQRGVDPLTVAILMGHADPSMLAKVYQHLAHDPAFLMNAARKASG